MDIVQICMKEKYVLRLKLGPENLLVPVSRSIVYNKKRLEKRLIPHKTNDYLPVVSPKNCASFKAPASYKRAYGD